MGKNSPRGAGKKAGKIAAGNSGGDFLKTGKLSRKSRLKLIGGFLFYFCTLGTNGLIAWEQR